VSDPAKIAANGGTARITRRIYSPLGKGSHIIFFKEGVPEIINLQSKGGKAKAYQVKQVRDLILKYQLELD